ncbi:MAG: hypothetical protein NDI60_02525 [Elusimicrobiales bacterium]|nr:hypothetical protein [Elusimicrobiales bacterium]
MKTIFKTFTVQSLALAFFSAACFAADYNGLALGLAAAARENGISRVLLGSFSAAAGAESEAGYALEKTAAGLALQRDLTVMDQESLQAYTGSREGWLKQLPSKMRPQGFIKGAVFQDGDSVSVMIKLVDARSGRVLRAVELRSAARFNPAPQAELPGLNWGDLPPVPEAPKDLRDALNEGDSCQASYRHMNRLNEAAVDLKARYWARKMKQPGFAAGSLSRNPGSEIRDSQVKQKFYELLSKYYGQEEVPALPEARQRQLEDFMDKEKSVIDRCGIN